MPLAKRLGVIEEEIGAGGMGVVYRAYDEKLERDLATVLAHEIGHHVQRLLGVKGKVRQAVRANPGARNELSVRHGAPD